jgi:hypothetical protein
MRRDDDDDGEFHGRIQSTWHRGNGACFDLATLSMEPATRYRSTNHPTPSTATSNGSASPTHRALSPSATSPDVIEERDEEPGNDEEDQGDVDSLADADDSMVEARALELLGWDSEDEGSKDGESFEWDDCIFLPRYEERSQEGIGERLLPSMLAWD